MTTKHALAPDPKITITLTRAEFNALHLSNIPGPIGDEGRKIKEKIFPEYQKMLMFYGNCILEVTTE